VQGSPLQRIRETKNMTQHQLAAAAGVSQATVAKIESGHRIGRVSTLRALARELEVSVGELLELEGGEN